MEPLHCSTEANEKRVARQVPFKVRLADGTVLDNDYSAANALLQSEKRIASSLPALQRSLAAAAAYEAADASRPVVRLTDGILFDDDCSAANALLQAEERVAPSVLAVQRGLAAAAAYEAADASRPVIRRLKDGNVYDDDCSAANALLQAEERVAPSVLAVRRGLVAAAAYEAADALDCDVPFGQPKPPSLWCDWTAFNASLDTAQALAPSVERMQQALAREQQRLLIRSQHKDSELLRRLCRNPEVCAHLERFMANYQAGEPLAHMPLPTASQAAQPRSPSPVTSNTRGHVHKRHPRKNKKQQGSHTRASGGLKAAGVTNGRSRHRREIQVAPQKAPVQPFCASGSASASARARCSVSVAAVSAHSTVGVA
jgi:hypothetical protein